MPVGPDPLLRYIRRSAVRREPDGTTDAALLNQFVAGQGEGAFAALVERHGPMVLQVCRRVLGAGDDAEDAFQATFLVLARKAARLRRPEALSAWLYGVARRVALKARSARTRRCRAARPLEAPPVDPRPDPLAELSARELLLTFDEELQRLPEAYRLPVILCCLEGRTLDEAARQLGWTPGSVKGRLERGRARLHERLVRRGLTLAAALTAVDVSRGVTSAALVARLLDRTVRGALAFGARQAAAAEGVSAGATALATEIVRAMALAKLTTAAALVLAACLLATAFQLRRTAPPVPPPEDPAAVADDRPAAPRDGADAPITVRGRVLDPEGKPLAGAGLYVGYAVRRYAPDLPVRPTTYPLRATSGADGRFLFTFARSELDARWLDDARSAVAAVADGYGPDWAEVGESAEGPELSLQLVEDLPVDGRLLDPNRQPVAGATVLVRGLISDARGGVTRFLRRDVNFWPPPGSWSGALPGRPRGTTTDADGRFRLTGLGRDRVVSLALEGPGIQHMAFEAATRPPGATPYWGRTRGAAFDYVAAPARPIRGVVRDKATGRPVAGATVTADRTTLTATTDEAGGFEIVGCPKAQGYLVTARAPTGRAYFAASAWVADRPGSDPLTVSLDLVSGNLLSGRVTDLATGKPPPAATVEYYPLPSNPRSRAVANRTGPASSARTGADGSYSLAVLPGPGVVWVAGSPRDSYAVAAVDDTGTAAATGVLCVEKYNARSPINPGEGAGSVTLDFTLQPARTLRGTVAGPDGQPLTGVKVVGLTALPDAEVLDGPSFTVAGLNPRRGRELIFHDRGKDLGKSLTVRGDETGPLTVRLEPCGTVLGRMVDKDGRPVTGLMVCFVRRSSIDVLAETDRDGRFRAALVPGQRYSLKLSTLRLLVRDVGAVEVNSGGSNDLGDLPLTD